MFSKAKHSKRIKLKMAEDECAESWEELEDSGELDKRLQTIEVKKPDPRKSDSSSESSSALSALREETNRSTYQPQVRILKRNTNSSQQSTPKQDGSQNKGRWRPLQEREAAYAEARMRIFGRAEGADDASNVADEYENSNISKQIQTLKVTDSVSIIRQPKGPDGSKGFGNR